jgi:serine/threonine-protein kinase RsbT
MAEDMPIIKKIQISKEIDVARVSFETKMFARMLGFKQNEQYMIATASSELATNIVKYAGKGGITLRKIEKNNKTGIEIMAEDKGLGIEDIGKAMKDNCSTAKSLGLGLPGVKRLMDEFTIDSQRNIGTKIIARKWA